MSMSNPRRNPGEESLRVQEFTGGFRGREMMGDYDVNPNENADGLSHISQYGAASQETREQMDPTQRKKKAYKEMEGDLPHISIKPEEIAETLNDTPMMNGESELLESAMGVDMGHKNGLGISAGANVGPVQREGPGMIFGRSEDAFEDAWSLVKNGGDEDLPSREEMIGDMEDQRAEMLQDQYSEMDEEKKGRMQGFMLSDLFELKDVGFAGTSKGGFMEGEPPITPELAPEAKRQAMEQMPHPLGGWPEGSFKWFAPTPMGEDHEFPEDWQTIEASAEPRFVSDIVKAKRKKKGRKYEEDEESEEEEKKAKKKGKRERKRKMKRGKKEASRQPESKSKRRAAAAEQNLTRHTKRQAFAPRRMFSGNPRAKDMPLRLRDPVAYQRKLAAEKFRREMGSLPTGQSAHADTRGITGERVQTIGMGGKGTKLPSQPSSSKGTSFKKPKTAERDAALLHDPLGGDALKMDIEKRLQSRATDISGFTRTELQSLKRDLKKLLEAVQKLTKSTPELGAEAKRGNQASEEKASAPTGPTENLKGWRFDDTSLMPVAFAGASKR